MQPNPNRAELSRLLVAADAGIDPHRLVRLCCERSAREPLSVSLLIPVDDESRAAREHSQDGAPATDVRADDRIHRQILAMADMLSDGIVAQFPKRFR
jgi:hypothetical protein